MNELLTLRSAARALAVSERTVRRLVTAGTLPHVRIGRAVRITPEDLATWIDQRITGRDTGTEDHTETQQPCHAPDRTTSRASTSARGRHSGGPDGQTSTGAKLAALLAFPLRPTPRG